MTFVLHPCALVYYSYIYLYIYTHTVLCTRCSAVYTPNGRKSHYPFGKASHAQYMTHDTIGTRNLYIKHCLELAEYVISMCQLVGYIGLKYTEHFK